MLKRLSVVLVLFVVAGCATKAPMNPQEAREALPSAWGGKKEQFSVKGDYKSTVRKLKRLSYSCFNKTVQGTTQTMMSNQVYKYSYTPTVKIGDKKTELYLQYNPGGLQLYDAPKDGSYILVMDIFNKGAGNMDVDLYTTSFWDTSSDAVKGWIRGEDEMCPEL